jgi:hypothetical protein
MDAMDGQEGSLVLKEATTTVGALVFQFDEESPVRLIELCKTMADRYSRLPAFGHCVSEQILGYLASEVLLLLDNHLIVSSSIEADPTYGTIHLSKFTINYDALCCDLAASAFDHFTSGGHTATS